VPVFLLLDERKSNNCLEGPALAVNASNIAKQENNLFIDSKFGAYKYKLSTWAQNGMFGIKQYNGTQTGNLALQGTAVPTYQGAEIW
jgi:hypothetical protein